MWTCSLISQVYVCDRPYYGLTHRNFRRRANSQWTVLALRPLQFPYFSRSCTDREMHKISSLLGVSTHYLITPSWSYGCHQVLLVEVTPCICTASVISYQSYFSSHTHISHLAHFLGCPKRTKQYNQLLKSRHSRHCEYRNIRRWCYDQVPSECGPPTFHPPSHLLDYRLTIQDPGFCTVILISILTLDLLLCLLKTSIVLQSQILHHVSTWMLRIIQFFWLVNSCLEQFMSYLRCFASRG